MRHIRPLVGLILAALMLTGAMGDPSYRPDLDPKSDDWLTVKVQTAFYRDQRFLGRRLAVEAMGGVVTLRGKVDSDQDRAAAVEIARSFDGVREVRNELTVVPPALRAQVEAKDGEIDRLLKDRLKRDPRLHDERIDTRVDAGVVTLTGEVNSSAAGAQAFELARGVPGVREVRSELVKVARPGLNQGSAPGRQRVAS
jgi:hyperosmotically inducible periplasmic protein